MQDDVTARRLGNIRELSQTDVVSVGTSQRQRPYFSHSGAAAWGKNDSNVINPIAFVNLPDSLAAISSPNDIEDFERIKAPAGDVVLPQPHQNLRHAGRRLDLDLGRATHAVQHANNFSCFQVQLVQVVAENVDHDRGPIAGQSLVNPFSQKTVGGNYRTGKLGDDFLNARLCHPHLLSVAGLQVHIYFTFMRSQGVGS